MEEREINYGSHVHEHTHAHMNLAVLSDHVRRYHQGDFEERGLGEPHNEHFIKVKEDWNHAARIDVNPLSLERLEKNPPVVYFGIEGSLKGCSMISAVIRTNEDAAVISVPAVGMWECPELEYFVNRYLMNCTIVIVPDGDWINKRPVIHQARCLQGRLLGLGCKRVLIAAPPVQKDTNGEPVKVIKGSKEVFVMTQAWNERKQKFEKLKGVDDYLGVGKGSLHALDCISHDPPNKDTVMAFLPTRKNSANLAVAITKLALLADPEGGVSVGFRTLANILGVSLRTVGLYIGTLVEIGAVKIVGGKLETKIGQFGEDWVNKPKIEIVPELRATLLPIRPLGEILGGE